MLKNMVLMLAALKAVTKNNCVHDLVLLSLMKKMQMVGFDNEQENKECNKFLETTHKAVTINFLKNILGCTF